MPSIGGGGQDVRAGGAFVELGTKDEKLNKGLDAAKKKVDKFAKNIAAAGAGIAALGAGIALPLFKFTKDFAAYGDELAKTSSRLGFTTEGLARWRHVAGLAGVATRDLDQSMHIFLRNLGDARRGAGEGLKAFEELGLSIDDLAMMPIEDALIIITDRIAELPLAADRAIIAYRLFGRQGIRLVNMLRQGSAALKVFMQEADLFGTTLKGGIGPLAERYTDQMFRVEQAVLGAKTAIAAGLAPAVERITAFLIKSAIAVRLWAEQNEGAIEGALRFAGSLTTVGLVMAGTAALVLLAMAPIVAIIGLIGLAVIALLDIFGIVDTGFLTMLDSIQDGGMSLKNWWGLMLNEMEIMWLEFTKKVGEQDWLSNTMLWIADQWNWLSHMVGMRSREDFEKYARKIEEASASGKNIWDDAVDETDARIDELIKANTELAKKGLEDGAGKGFSELWEKADQYLKKLQQLEHESEGLDPSLLGITDPAGADAARVPDRGGFGFFGSQAIASQLGFLFGGKDEEKKQTAALGRIEDVLKDIREQGGEASYA